MSATERLRRALDHFEGVGHEHPGLNHSHCRAAGRKVFTGCKMQCCGVQLGDTPEVMWWCEAEAWCLEQHPFYVACPELQ